MIYDSRKNNSHSMVSNLLLITYASHADFLAPFPASTVHNISRLIPGPHVLVV
jgi:hypothetical protein